MIRITASRDASQRFKENIAGVNTRLQGAMAVAANMIASMLVQAGRSNIAASGNFGIRWIAGLHADVQKEGGDYTISLYHDIPFAGIFEDGGVIQGHPLLWIPLSSAPNVPARLYGGQLFSAKSRRGTPLLFSTYDKQPKYFGIESVRIPPKWHLKEAEISIMSRFSDAFAEGMRE